VTDDMEVDADDCGGINGNRDDVDSIVIMMMM